MQLHGEGYLLFNILMDALCVVSAGRFLGIDCSWKRVLLSALTGGAYALLVLRFPWCGGLAFLAVSSLAMSAAAFPRRHVLRGAGGIWLVGLCGSGVMSALQGATWAVPAAGAFMLSFCLMGKREGKAQRGVVRVEYGGRSVCLPVLVDSGNLLQDVESGLPVVVAPECLCGGLPLLRDALPRIAAQTAGGRAVFPLFRPERFVLRLGLEKKREISVMVALTDAPLPAALLPAAALKAKTNIKEARHAKAGDDHRMEKVAGSPFFRHQIGRGGVYRRGGTAASAPDGGGRAGTGETAAPG